MKNISLRISERISEAIEKSQLSYRELSKATGIPTSTLQRYATGQTDKIPIDKVESIARVTKVSAAYIMGWEENNIHNCIIGNQNNNNTINILAEPHGEMETEIISLCRKMNIQQKNKLLTYAYELLEK